MKHQIVGIKQDY